MKRSFLIILLVAFFSCSKEKKNMMVHADIEGLQKGKFYLQKVKDTLLINVDSIEIDKGTQFTLSDNIESPEIYFLSLSGSDKILQFFGEQGEIHIKTSMDNFNYTAEITGSKNQELLDEYNETMQKFSDLNLDLYKQKLEAAKADNNEEIQKIDKEIENISKRKLRYTLNFAFNHADHEVSPYLTLLELYRLNTRYLDTIANNLTPEVKTSTYGKKLLDYIEEIKE